MNGPEHYQKAERLINDSHNRAGDDPFLPIDVAEAQVHATLALAAAVAEGSPMSLVRAPQGEPSEPFAYDIGSPWGRVLYPKDAT